MNAASSLFDARRRHYETSSNAFMQAVNEGRYPSIDALCKEQDVLISTPADSLADVAYKLKISIGDIDEVGGENDSLALLRRALVALQAGSSATAIRALNAALNGETDWDFAYLSAAAALADLQRLSR